MGNADGEVERQIPAPEIEAWMDEALGVVDEGFENLLGLVTILNERTKRIMLELKILESFRNVFIALNFLIVPVGIAIMLCYGTKESVDKNSRGYEAGLQSLVMLLMFLSTTVGLPLYVFYVWESYKLYESMHERPNNQSLSSESQGSALLSDDNLLTLPIKEPSLERLNELARLLNNRMPPRRRSAETDSSEQRMEGSSEIEMESAVPETSASVEHSEEKQDKYLDSAEAKPHTNATEFPVLHQFQVLMKERSSHQAARKRGERKETSENEDLAEQHGSQRAKSQDGEPTIAGIDKERTDSAVFSSHELHSCEMEFSSLEISQH